MNQYQLNKGKEEEKPSKIQNNNSSNNSNENSNRNSKIK